ncbi:hybrid sensor histidine kinase/response regulator [Pseudomonas sp. GD04087]|uniref:PAS domain-containing hybrid sensor histidine kinase/response regulator n=1 Tax=Pseudomonas TaxID=286 RepID=UPI00244A9952|nr:MULTISPECIES: PAS domain-containing hybrid sensor histidine kinase/response regulator [Pseudomonas]MCP1651580.1 Na+/proline symporter/signal transduction histidine kinase [Pseudomonas nitroreducens]MCP1684555.1 Na+/proline symporter/signal transduction histidine kinase [Pseudomonas nitroreducens]MDH0288345.1 hybrid sensor histidine kinase/response regulator [Pseudomonas sp. GD04087]MDH1047643.1 hybrid sensor histidine kinase/response regulator [Pseudomonas sp. GD03903]MDH2000139.1 hybrid se
MSLSSGLIATVALLYMAVLFAIAFYGDRRRAPLSPRVRAWVYSLSLAVYCTSWTFFGAVGQAADQLWSFLPIYVGPVLLMLFAPWVLQKMIMISKQENITSIADFIAARYGKSQALAVVVALICVVCVLPYIALQLKGIVLGVNLLIGAGPDSTGIRAQDTALIVSLILALFTIVFGTRNLDVTEHHRGMVLAIAFESLVKLTAFLAVGIFVTYGLYDGFGDLVDKARVAPQLNEYWKETVHWPAMLLQTGVAMTAIMCLPRQFHVLVVENIEPRDLNLARWVFPIYLVLAALFVVPIALAGQMHLPAGVMPDSFVISLPLAEAHPALALLAFIGGASAATGMVIVASVALSTMVSNDMLLPWLLRRKGEAEQPFEVFRHWLLTVRRVSIALILLLAYVSYRLLGSTASLATIGQIAFAAIAQLGPAMIGALYWKQANRRGVFAGLAAGSFLWAYTLVLPVVAKGLGWPLETFPGLAWLAGRPFGLSIEPLTLGVLLSLIGNFALFGLVSVFSRTRVSEHWQASRFIGQEISQKLSSRSMLAVQLEDLLMLAARFVGEERARQSFIRFAYRQGKGFTPSQNANDEWIAHTERLLAGVLGASSARAVVKAAIEGREMQVEDVVKIADEASEVLQFNRALLQGAIENITQGISVVDQSLRLVAWNHRYIELFEYPDGLIYVGRPIADIIRYNAERGLCGPGDPDLHVAKRLYWMRQGTPHTSERLFPNGRVIELIGNPMPGGGFVMSFTDITNYRDAEQGLKDANEGLEQRVQERTFELSQLNQALTEAKGTAEAANQSKSRFLAAVSHDLMQPLNAARLFSAALAHQEKLPEEATELVRHLDSSLRSAEDLITDLLDISRLEGGRVSADVAAFPLSNLYDTLGVEFRVLAQEHGIDFHVRGSKLRVESDIKLLRRVLQNFLTNAFRYAKGHVLLGVRREAGHLRLEVWDHGPGIPPDKLQVIFEEFKRLDSHQTRAEKGLGLGLAIADRLCKVLGHRLQVRSWPGKGSVFSVSVPLARQPAPVPLNGHKVETPEQLNGAQVLCVDNEDSILTGMNSLLTRWGCRVLTARSREECQALLDGDARPQLALIDYHLDDGELGTDLMAWLRTRLGEPVPGVVISADARPELVAQIHAAGLDFLPKPVKPAALRALLSRHLSLR